MLRWWFRVPVALYRGAELVFMYRRQALPYSRRSAARSVKNLHHYVTTSFGRGRGLSPFPAAPHGPMGTDTRKRLLLNHLNSAFDLLQADASIYGDPAYAPAVSLGVLQIVGTPARLTALLMTALNRHETLVRPVIG